MKAKVWPLQGEERPDFMTDKLHDVFSKGLLCNFVTFTDSSPASCVAFYAMSHLQENNKFKETTLRATVVVSGKILILSLV